MTLCLLFGLEDGLDGAGDGSHYASDLGWQAGKTVGIGFGGVSDARHWRRGGPILRHSVGFSIAEKVKCSSSGRADFKFWGKRFWHAKPLPRSAAGLGVKPRVRIKRAYQEDEMYLVRANRLPGLGLFTYTQDG